MGAKRSSVYIIIRKWKPGKHFYFNGLIIIKVLEKAVAEEDTDHIFKKIFRKEEWNRIPFLSLLIYSSFCYFFSTHTHICAHTHTLTYNLVLSKIFLCCPSLISSGFVNFPLSYYTCYNKFGCYSQPFFSVLERCFSWSIYQ